MKNEKIQSLFVNIYTSFAGLGRVLNHCAILLGAEQLSGPNNAYLANINKSGEILPIAPEESVTTVFPISIQQNEAVIRPSIKGKSKAP